jgi:TetR/AcrR family transcriptional repressor of nem operon
VEGTIKERLRAYFELIQSDARKGGAYGCMMVNSAVELARDDAETAHRISDHFDKLEEIFVGMLRKAQVSGQIANEKNLVAVARFMLNVSRGLRVMVTYEKDREVFEDIVNLALSLLDS